MASDGQERRQEEETPTRSLRSPWYRRLGLLTLAGLLTLLVIGYLGVAWLIPELTGLGCSVGERRALKEISHYGDQQVRVYSAEVSCNASYTTSATRNELLGHYDEQLRQNEWEVFGFWAANPPQRIEFSGEKLSDISEAPEEGVRAGLGASRGDYSLGITYHPPGESPEYPADQAGVLVQVTDEPPPGGGKGHPK